MPNKADAQNPAMTSQFQRGHHRRRVGDLRRSPTARVAWSYSEVLKGRQVIAQDKRSAVPGQGPKMNTSLFSKLGWQSQPNFEKREISGGGVLPRTAASEALSRAIIELPLRGVGRSLPEANKALDRMTSSAVTQFGETALVFSARAIHARNNSALNQTI